MPADESFEHKVEEARGKAKEEVGKATDDEEMEDQGRREQAGDKIKDAFRRSAIPAIFETTMSAIVVLPCGVCSELLVEARLDPDRRRRGEELCRSSWSTCWWCPAS